MNKREMTQKMSKELGISNKKAKEAIDMTLGLIREAVIVEGRITLHDFGTLKTIVARERKARNPRTGEEVIVPQQIKVKFKPSNNFLD